MDTVEALDLEGERRTNQLHLELGELSLEGMVDALTDTALETAGPNLAWDRAECRPLVRAALRQALKRWVVAFDVCGLSTFCQDASRFDPWT
jgi:uncharacterized protein YfaT (DUF1175 family)